MPRNSSGVYTLPGGNPVTPGDVIEAEWANTTLEDVANELTNSLSRTGAGGMLAPFRIADGNVSGPGLSYLNETNTGLYRSGSGSTWMSVLGVNTVQFSTVGLTVAAGKALTVLGNASASGTLSITGATTLASTLAVTGAITATGGVVGNVTGNVTAASGTSTFNDVVITGALDMTAGSSATITGLSTPTNASDAANKGYVDSQDALRLALTGGTMSGAIAMGSSKITGLATPTADADAATKAYVDSVAQGLDVKGSCRVATVANISLSGTQTIDGVAVIAGDRVLVKDQSTAANNGIYVVAAGSWSRAADADTWAELVGAFTFVEEGTVNDNSGWVCTSPAGGTLGVTAVTWEQFSGAGQITAGAGLFKSGNTLNVGTASSARIVVGTDDIDLATTGVTASTYKSVTVDAYGRVTGGTNPTTLAGYGITDAYTQAQVDAALALKLNLTGGTMSGAIAMGTNKITGLGDPTLAQDAATKNYIDTIFGSTTTAAASAAAAAASASAASSFATSASGSASAASASASAAAASFDSFDDRYLGAKASDPSTDNDGNALLTGALYWNTTSNQMRVYTGSAWEAAYLPASGYAALASANVFTANQTISANTSSAALSITQAGSGNALYIEDVAADATPFVVSSTGAVGIGTTTPDNVTSAGIALVSNDGYYPQVVNRNKTNDSNASYIVFDKDRAGAVVQSGDSLGNVLFRSFDGANYLQSAAIIGYSDGTAGSNDVPGRLAFLTTADGASAPTERFRIASTGAWGLTGANYGSAGQVLTSNGSGSAPTWQSGGGGGGSAATPTALGTVYGKTDTGSITFLGYQAGNASSTAAHNVAVGASAMAAITTGTRNIVLGSYAAGALTTGEGNIVLGTFGVGTGTNTFSSNTSGTSNIAIGGMSLTANTTASNNIAIGERALSANTTGTPNLAVGISALQANTTGSNNVALGDNTLRSNTTASYSTAVGYQAGYSSTSAETSAFGYRTLWLTTGAGNTAFGSYAGGSVTTGSNNGFFGYNAGYYVTTGSKNTILGAYTGNFIGLDIRTLSNKIVLSDGDGVPAVVIGMSPNGSGAYTNDAGMTTVGTGNTGGSATGALSLNGSTATGYGPIVLGYKDGSIIWRAGTKGWIDNSTDSSYQVKVGSTGGAYISSGGTSWTAVSDERMKDIIEPITNAINKVTQLRAVIGKYKTDEEGTRRSFLIAQDVKAVLPEAVNSSNLDELGVTYTDVIPLLVAAIKELKTEFDAYKASHP